MRKFLRSIFTSSVAAAMFVVRMLMLGLMTLLQLTLGGAEIRSSKSGMPVAH